MPNAEEWRPVVGWEGLYEVSSLGRVRSLDRVNPSSHRGRAYTRLIPGRILRSTTLPSGYVQVTLADANGGRRNVKATVHRLVAIAFHGPPPPGHEAAHRNGQKPDNAAGNLVWATSATNAAHRGEHGTQVAGMRHPLHRLTTVQLDEVRGLRPALSFAEIARRFEVSGSHVRRIVAGATRRTG